MIETSQVPLQTQPPPPQFPPQTPPIAPPPPPNHSSKRTAILVSVIILLIAVVGSAAYAYVAGIGPFAPDIQSEQGFLKNLVSKAGTMSSAAYTLSGSFTVVDRDPDAVPFSVPVSNIAEIRQQYQNDATRARDVMDIISTLRFRYGPVGSGKTNPPSSYPASLSQFVADAKAKKFMPARGISIVDPLTQKEYSYKVVDGGKDFLLEVTFETNDAIKSIERSAKRYATSTTITGKKVVFRGSSSQAMYVYVNPEPPKPFLVQYSEYLRYVSPDVSGTVSATVFSEKKTDTLADWTLAFNAEGSLGDLMYKMNAEALKKNTDYYFKVNNMPFFAGMLSNIKGKWVKVSAEATKKPEKNTMYGYGGSSLSYFAQQLPDLEKRYKENRQVFGRLLVSAAEIGDDVGLIVFKDSPKKETIDGRELIKYSVDIKKEAVLAFYDRLAAEVKADAKYRDYSYLFTDTGVRNYLQSPEFDQVFDYLSKNIQFAIWVDKNGHPAIIEESFRLVPPDTADQLRDKQALLVMRLIISKINEPVNIQAPAGAVSVEELSKKEIENKQYAYDPSGATAIKTHLSALRVAAELVYDETQSSYGKKPFTLGSCKKTPGTLFEHVSIADPLNKATNNKPDTATCVSTSVGSKVTSYAISVPLPSDSRYSWCVDSKGASKQIVGALKGGFCS